MATKEIIDISELSLEILGLLARGEVEINSIKSLLHKRRVEASKLEITEALKWLYVKEDIEFSGDFSLVPPPFSPASPADYFITVSVKKKIKSGSKPQKDNGFSTFLEATNRFHPKPKGAK